MARMYYTNQEIEILDNMDNLEELNDCDSDYESVFWDWNWRGGLIVSFTDNVTVRCNITV